MIKNGFIKTPEGRVFAPGLEARGQNQRGRVAQGIQSGALSGEEVDVLKEMRGEAFAGLTEAKGDNGWVGPKERRQLHRELNQISQTIYALKHN